MDINELCLGCMHKIDNKEQLNFCPVCGYDFKNIKSEQHQLPPKTILKDKYIIGKVLGEGGFGITYMGFDKTLEMPVAIKEFYPSGYVTRDINVSKNVTIYAGNNIADIEKWRDNFIREARSLAKFTNLSGIVKVQEYINENDTAYIVMEYVDGITVKKYLKQCGGRIPVEQVLQMMEPVILSLAKVHEKEMIHRDISPDNIMINSLGCMKLLDFGAAREVSVDLEKSLSVMLKPGYAPEEQYRTKGKQGPWSDVYAICATIYKCITGVTPVEAMERIRNDSIIRPSELGIDIEPYQEEALMAGMAVYANERIQNMSALHNALYNAGEEKSTATMTFVPALDVSNMTVPLTEKHTSVSKTSHNTKNKKTKTKNKKSFEKIVLTGLIATICVLCIAIGMIFVFMKTKDVELADNDLNIEEMDDGKGQQNESVSDEDKDNEKNSEELSDDKMLSEEELAELEEIDALAANDKSVENLKDVLEQYYSFAEKTKLPDEISEKAVNVFTDYYNGVMEHILFLEQQEVMPAMYIQMKIELDDAMSLSQKYCDLGVNVDYSQLKSKLDGLKVNYKQRLINNFDVKASQQISSNGVISRSALWPLMQRADETGLYDENDLNDPLRLRYITAYTYSIDSELDSLDQGQAIARIYDVLEKTDCSPLLLYYLAEYGDLNGKNWYSDVSQLLSYYSSDFDGLSKNEKRNYIFYYITYDNAREEVRKYMEQSYKGLQR